MIIQDFAPFVGAHCETTATGNLLRHTGIDISEAMMFGVGEGLSFLLFPVKGLNLPFIGGRTKPFELTRTLCANLGCRLMVEETSSSRKAWNAVKRLIDVGEPVGLQLDSYHLEYFTSRVHFAGHTIAMYGYDDSLAYVVDTAQQGGATKTSLNSLAMARSEKGPMSARNRSFSVRKPETPVALTHAITGAIRRNAQQYLNPPITNFAYKGILKFARQVESWYDKCEDPTSELSQVGSFMERAGTGGSIFRNLYRDFLLEAFTLVEHEAIAEAADLFAGVAARWKECADLFDRAGAEASAAPLQTISHILEEIATQEKRAMEVLSTL